MNGIERMRRMYEGEAEGVPVSLFFSTEYMCLHSGVPDYRFLYGPHEHRAAAHIKIGHMHDLDSLWLWPRGKRDDWRRDYKLVEEGGGGLHLGRDKESQTAP